MKEETAEENPTRVGDFGGKAYSTAPFIQDLIFSCEQAGLAVAPRRREWWRETRVFLKGLAA